MERVGSPARYRAQQGCPPAGAVPDSHWVRTARKLWENRAALPNQVYLAAAFDLGGGCDGNSGPPPTGSPVVVHGSTAPGKPAAAVETGGEDTAVTVTFDDTVLMP